MKIATWNVNSIKARTAHVQRWLERVQPDILCLQELKGLDFPEDAFPGYQPHSVTQKAYNGVALLSRHPAEILLTKLPGDEEDEQARYIEADIAGLRLINIYLPNGNPAPGDKFTYKLNWMERLCQRLYELRANETPFLITGDFNVIPEPHDCWDPALWAEDALYRIETRRAFRKLLHLGLTDAFRALNQNDKQYTFWDYQAGCWPKNKGIRIDHFLTSPPVTDRIRGCAIDRIPRGEESPSDHTPVILELRG
ncbi:MAG: exodeoxyribonuclease III [Micavibrio sp.]